MSTVNIRSLVKLAALTALSAAVLVGCGKKEEAAAPEAAAPAAAIVLAQLATVVGLTPTTVPARRCRLRLVTKL